MYNDGDRAIPYLNEFLTFRESKIYPNNRPGLSVTSNMERPRPVARFNQAINRPTYFRPDGSQTNW
jgi:galactonate dehydratase